MPELMGPSCAAVAPTGGRRGTEVILQRPADRKGKVFNPSRASRSCHISIKEVKVCTVLKKLGESLVKAQLYIDTDKGVDDVNLSLPIGMGVRVHAATSIFQPLFLDGSRFLGQDKTFSGRAASSQGRIA